MGKKDLQTQNNDTIPSTEIASLLGKIKIALRERGIRDEVIEGTRIVVIHPDDWEISLLVPYRNLKVSQIKKPIEEILYNVCGIEERCCDYLGRWKEEGAYEWYFRHPNIPQEIYDRLEQKLEAKLGEEIGMGLPKPSGIKAIDAPAFVTVREEVFDQIARGDKTTEYRNLNQYYCDKFFPAGKPKKLIKFNRGYKAGKENQMVFEIDSIMLVSERGDEISAFDSDGKLIESYGNIPPMFAPVAYGIKLGKRIS